MSTPAEVAWDLSQLGIEGRQRMRRVVVAHGELLKTAVVRNASQPRTQPRPGTGDQGPRRLTATYARSITRTTVHLAASSSSIVGTNQERGPRLEHGFVGVDALGRSIDQVPYPHFGPAADEVKPLFLTAVNDAILGGDEAP